MYAGFLKCLLTVRLQYTARISVSSPGITKVIIGPVSAQEWGAENLMIVRGVGLEKEFLKASLFR